MFLQLDEVHFFVLSVRCGGRRGRRRGIRTERESRLPGYSGNCCKKKKGVRSRLVKKPSLSPSLPPYLTLPRPASPQAQQKTCSREEGFDHLRHAVAGRQEKRWWSEWSCGQDTEPERKEGGKEEGVNEISDSKNLRVPEKGSIVQGSQ